MTETSNTSQARPTRISDVVKLWSECMPDQPALVETGRAWTYQQLASITTETRDWLRGLGIRPGDRVMIVCENCRSFVAILLALAEMDAWPVLANARLSGREIDQIRDHCGARLVIYTTSVSAQAREHAHRHGARIRVVADLGSLGIGPLNEEIDPEPLEPDPGNRVASVIYTSGTTGLAKGVMLTHRNLLFVAAASAKIRALTPADRMYGILPMSHAVGLSVVLLGSLLSGSVLYLSPRFDPVAALAALNEDRLTIMLGAPAMFALFVEYAKLKGIRSVEFPSLRIISSSGAPLQPALKSEVEALFGLPLNNGYGITECSPNIAQTSVEAHRDDTSVGVPLPGIEIRLVGSDGQPVSEGEIGELWVRGPNVMKGYYRSPQETDAVINGEGWFNTRDLARLKEGNLFIVGRTRELIVRFGYNVYPVEVEAILNAYPGVARSAVIGRTIEGDGNEEVVAFVQITPGAVVTSDQLTGHAMRHLAPYKQPSYIFLVDSMPVTATGKVIKFELERLLAKRLTNNPTRPLTTV